MKTVNEGTLMKHREVLVEDHEPILGGNTTRQVGGGVVETHRL